ncbi:MAG: Fe-S cluster assembly protein SufD, partial [Hasllibacter sp.]
MAANPGTPRGLNPNGRRARGLAAKREATEARLADLRLPDGPAWAAEARRDALGRVRAMGLPARADEYWRYTDPAPLTAAEPVRAAPLDGAEAALFGDAEALRVVFVDGVFDAEASDALAMEGIEIARLSEAADLHWARGLYGALEARGQDPVDRPLAALNTATAADGVLIRATGRAARPVHLIHRHEAGDSDAVLHHVVRLEEGAALTLLETGPAGARSNAVLEVDVADGAAFHHVREQGRDHKRRAATA